MKEFSCYFELEVRSSQTLIILGHYYDIKIIYCLVYIFLQKSTLSCLCHYSPNSRYLEYLDQELLLRRLNKTRHKTSHHSFP